jgi:Cation/multidrug efflux pump
VSAGRFNLSALAVRERSITLFLICLISLAGLLSFFKLGRAEDPGVHHQGDDHRYCVAGRHRAGDARSGRRENRKAHAGAALVRPERDIHAARPGLHDADLLDSTPPSEVQEEFYQARKKIGDEAANLPAGVIGPMVNDEYAEVTFALFALKARGEPQRLLVRDAETLRSGCCTCRA